MAKGKGKGKEGKGGKGAARDAKEPQLRQQNGVYALYQLPNHDLKTMNELHAKFKAAEDEVDAVGPREPYSPGDCAVLMTTLDPDSEMCSAWAWQEQPIYPTGPHRTLNEVANQLRGTAHLITCVGFRMGKGALPKTMINISSSGVTDLDIIARDLREKPSYMNEILGYGREEFISLEAQRRRNTPPVCCKVVPSLMFDILEGCDLAPVQLLRKGNEMFARNTLEQGDPAFDASLKAVIDEMNSVCYSDDVWGALQSFYAKSKSESKGEEDRRTVLGSACVVEGLTVTALEAELEVAKIPNSRAAVCSQSPLMAGWRSQPLANALKAARYNAYILMARAVSGQSTDEEADRRHAGLLWGIGDA